MKKDDFLKLIKNKLIVSCQAEPDDALYGPEIMSKMSLTAKQGGAVAIRANGKEDILAIRKATKLPTIGIIKKSYIDSEVYITPTLEEIKELIESKTDVIALDATERKRPHNMSLKCLVNYIRENSDCLIMGDISTVKEGIKAVATGCDFISTTLSGYTPYSRQLKHADFKLIQELSGIFKEKIAIIAEGRINTPDDAKKAIKLGAHSVVVGTSITRPSIITSRFASSLS